MICSGVVIWQGGAGAPPDKVEASASDKAEDAKDAASAAVDSVGSAASQAADAVSQKASEVKDAAAETHKAFSLFADGGEYGRAGKFGNVVCDCEGAECSRPFGVHASFGYYLAVEVSNLFGVPRVLKQYRATFAGCLYVLMCFLRI